MCSYDGDNLFESGPCRFHVGGRELRYTQAATIGADGLTLRTEGRSARAIRQSGTLRADSMAQLRALGDAIEARLDGRSATLVDHDGEAYEQTVMTRFEREPARRLGTRWCVDYRIEYVQVLP